MNVCVAIPESYPFSRIADRRKSRVWPGLSSSNLSLTFPISMRTGANCGSIPWHGAWRRNLWAGAQQQERFRVGEARRHSGQGTTRGTSFRFVQAGQTRAWCSRSLVEAAMGKFV